MLIKTAVAARLKQETMVCIDLVTSILWKKLLLWRTDVSISCWLFACQEFLQVLPKMPMLSLCPEGTRGALRCLQTSASPSCTARTSSPPCGGEPQGKKAEEECTSIWLFSCTLCILMGKSNTTGEKALQSQTAFGFGQEYLLFL